jgi:hypothetical protein
MRGFGNLSQNGILQAKIGTNPTRLSNIVVDGSYIVIFSRLARFSQDKTLDLV